MRTIPTGNQTQTVEVWPAHCRNGHRLGPGQVTGYYQVARGRIIRCLVCRDEQDEITGYSE